MTKSEFLKKLYKKCGMTTEDYFTHPKFGFTIFTRTGIEKVQAAYNINVQYQVISHDLGNVIIKAIARDPDGKEVESFGESSPENNRQNYPVAIAEKRALSRVILKITGAYMHKVFGEDEGDNGSFNQAQLQPQQEEVHHLDGKKSITTKQLDRMKSAILKGDITAEEAFEAAENAGLLVPESIKYSYKNLKVQA